ncbi:hypothetical protein GCM10017557_67400 [Streptomyces aurantiacus]|uniref:DUF6314 domain-containing protein n=2 Tax=Streptomyces aurantiacus TaxID=47760 RepID=A0A7G1PBE6_9ACTN|nr:hypothetical protein GCM10017557_67400 [Streptomyces aurantiacus]
MTEAMAGFRPVSDVLAYLAGGWRVERSVRDLASGASGTFGGTTVFERLDGDDSGAHPHPGSRSGLLHHESGTFVWQGVARPAERTLRFLPGDGAGRARVQFADGRPFHDLDLTSGRYVADHPCSADLYRGEFTVYDADRWRTVWRVGGPAKDLVLTTDYTRSY